MRESYVDIARSSFFDYSSSERFSIWRWFSRATSVRACVDLIYARGRVALYLYRYGGINALGRCRLIFVEKIKDLLGNGKISQGCTRL